MALSVVAIFHANLTRWPNSYNFVRTSNDTACANRYSSDGGSALKPIRGCRYAQTEYCFRSWPLGRRLLLQQIDSSAASRGPRCDLLAAWTGFPEKRRGLRHPLLRAGQRPCGPCRPLLRRYSDHARGPDDRAAALVYIAALAPDETETSQSQQQKFPVADVFSHIEVADGRIWLKPDGIGCFAGDLPEAEQKVVWATQTAFAGLRRRRFVLGRQRCRPRCVAKLLDHRRGMSALGQKLPRRGRSGASALAPKAAMAVADQRGSFGP